MIKNNMLKVIPGGPLIEIPNEIQSIINNSFYSEKYKLELILFNKYLQENNFNPLNYFKEPMSEEEHHLQYNPNHYCFKCQGECNVTKIKKNFNFVNKNLYVQIKFIYRKEFKINSNFTLDPSETTVVEKTPEIITRRVENKLYFKKGIPDVINNLVKNGLDKESLIKNNFSEFITTENTGSFYKNDEQNIEIKTGNLEYKITIKYSEGLAQKITTFFSNLSDSLLD